MFTNILLSTFALIFKSDISLVVFSWTIFIWFRYQCYACFIARIRPLFFIFQCSGTTHGVYGLSDVHAWVELSCKTSGLNPYVWGGSLMTLFLLWKWICFYKLYFLRKLSISLGFLLWPYHRNRMDSHPKIWFGCWDW